MFRRNFVRHFLIAFCVLLVGRSWAQSALTPDEIIQKVDDIRSPVFDYKLVISVISYKPNHPPHTSVFEIFSKGREKTVIRTLQPEGERGICLLMQGQAFQAFFPQVSKPIHLSLQERLTGEVANGDIARTNFSDDYHVEFLRLEYIDGKNYDVLRLTAKNENTAYGKVLLWVRVDNFWPLKAFFYGVSGRFLKDCIYKDFKILGGQMRPSRLVIEDGVIKGQYSVMDYKEIQKIKIPDSFFTKDNLMQLKMVQKERVQV